MGFKWVEGKGLREGRRPKELWKSVEKTKAQEEDRAAKLLPQFVIVFFMEVTVTDNKGDKQPTIAVDFDGVIADYDGWESASAFGPPRGDVIEVLKVLRSEGWKIVVYSCRASEEIGPYLRENSVPFDEINQNSSSPARGAKPVATVYWDDRAFCYSGNAQKDLEKLRNFRTWSGRR